MLEQRTEKGIWQNLYQFPLVESNKTISIEALKKQSKTLSKLNDSNYSISLYNQKDIVHKLSHQHLYTRFWIIEIDTLPKHSINISDIRQYPVPILIGNFIEQFNF